MHDSTELGVPDGTEILMKQARKIGHYNEEYHCLLTLNKAV